MMSVDGDHVPLSPQVAMLSFVFIVALLAAATPHPLREAGTPFPPSELIRLIPIF
jgi:hypothetical protein